MSVYRVYYILCLNTYCIRSKIDFNNRNNYNKRQFTLIHDNFVIKYEK